MRKAQAATRDAHERYVAILDHLCEQGRLGRKASAGYYSYPESKQLKASDAVVREIIQQASQQRGISRRTLSLAETRRRTLLSMVNEAALLLKQGVAARPSDIDVVLVQGYGCPRWEGGPVFWARERGAALARDLDWLAEVSGPGFVRGDVRHLL